MTVRRLELFQNQKKPDGYFISFEKVEINITYFNL